MTPAASLTTITVLAKALMAFAAGEPADGAPWLTLLPISQPAAQAILRGWEHDIEEGTLAPHVADLVRDLAALGYVPEHFDARGVVLLAVRP